MTTEEHSHSFAASLGMASVVIGFIALFLFFLPVLAVPLALFALAFGIAGFIAALFVKGRSLRWTLGGLAVSLVALAVTGAIALY